jgi:glycosyltransferase involved in cell wall biosynthesis
LFGGGALRDVGCPYSQIANLPRDSFLTHGWLPWRYRYLFEQLTAAGSLMLRRPWRDFDIMHIADPDLALQMRRRTEKTGLRVIYKDGLLLGPPFCRNFDFVHVLAPYYREEAESSGIDVKNWFVIPHMVNSEQFRVARNKEAIRKASGLAIEPGALVALAVGDFSPESNKRLDWIVSEFAAMGSKTPAYLCLAGQSSESDFTNFERKTKALLGNRAHIFRNLGADEITRLYQAADLFAHAALREPFGIVLIEAMATGLPVVGHHFPVTKWIIGDGGTTIDMTQAGCLTSILELWSTDSELRNSLGEKARARATSEFSPRRVIPLYESMYHKVASTPRLLQ